MTKSVWDQKVHLDHTMDEFDVRVWRLEKQQIQSEIAFKLIGQNKFKGLSSDQGLPQLKNFDQNKYDQNGVRIPKKKLEDFAKSSFGGLGDWGSDLVLSWKPYKHRDPEVGRKYEVKGVSHTLKKPPYQYTIMDQVVVDRRVIFQVFDRLKAVCVRDNQKMKRPSQIVQDLLREGEEPALKIIWGLACSNCFCKYAILDSSHNTVACRDQRGNPCWVPCPNPACQGLSHWDHRCPNNPHRQNCALGIRHVKKPAQKPQPKQISVNRDSWWTKDGDLDQDKGDFEDAVKSNSKSEWPQKRRSDIEVVIETDGISFKSKSPASSSKQTYASSSKQTIFHGRARRAENRTIMTSSSRVPQSKAVESKPKQGVSPSSQPVQVQMSTPNKGDDLKDAGNSPSVHVQNDQDVHSAKSKESDAQLGSESSDPLQSRVSKESKATLQSQPADLGHDQQDASDTSSALMKPSSTGPKQGQLEEIELNKDTTEYTRDRKSLVQSDQECLKENQEHSENSNRIDQEPVENESKLCPDQTLSPNDQENKLQTNENLTELEEHETNKTVTQNTTDQKLSVQSDQDGVQETQKHLESSNKFGQQTGPIGVLQPETILKSNCQDDDKKISENETEQNHKDHDINTNQDLGQRDSCHSDKSQ